MKNPSSRPLQIKISLLAALVVPIALSTAHAATTVSWKTTAASTDWIDSANWTGGVPTNDLTTNIASFGPSYTSQPNAGTTQVNGIEMGTYGGTSLTISGTTLGIGSGGITIVAQSNQFNTISATTVQLGANQTWANNSDGVTTLLQVTSAVTNLGDVAPVTLSLTGKANIQISGVISNGGSTGTTALVVDMEGGILRTDAIVRLGAASPNTFSGGMAVKSGAVVAETDTAFGNNTIQLGDSTGISAVNATLIIYPNNANVTNAINVVGTGVGGAKNVIGAGWDDVDYVTYSGAVTLNSTDVILGGAGTRFNNLNFSGGFTGTGNITIKTDGMSNNQNIFLHTGAVNNVGTVTNSGTGVLGAIRDVTIDTVIGANVTGVIQNSSNSMLILKGANTYTGSTAVNAGTLLLSGSGSINSTSGVSVSAGATLTNNSSVAYNKNLTLAEGAVVNGSGAFASSNLTITADLSGGFTTFAMGSTSFTKSGNLELTLSGITVGTYSLFSGSALSSTFGTMTIGGNSLTSGGGGDFSGLVGGYNYTFTNASNELIVAVPEPTTWALLLTSGLAMVAFRRRRAA